MKTKSNPRWDLFRDICAVVTLAAFFAFCGYILVGALQL